MRSWVGIEVGKVIKNVCYVVMSVRVSVMCCGSVQHNSSSRADLLLKLQEKLGNGFERFDALDSLGKSSFILGSELWEEHFDSLLPLVKDDVVDIWEERKIKLYGDDSSQSQSSTGDLGEFTGIEGQSGKNMCQGGKPDTGKFHSSYIGMDVCGSAYENGCVVDGTCATAAD